MNVAYTIKPFIIVYLRFEVTTIKKRSRNQLRRGDEIRSLCPKPYSSLVNQDRQLKMSWRMPAWFIKCETSVNRVKDLHLNVKTKLFCHWIKVSCNWGVNNFASLITKPTEAVLWQVGTARWTLRSLEITDVASCTPSPYDSQPTCTAMFVLL